MKKDEKTILIITILILFSSFLISNPSVMNIVGRTIFSAKAVSDTTALRITIINMENGAECPESGNVTFSDPNINTIIPSITGLMPGCTMNISMYQGTYPNGWNEPEPTANEVRTKFRYFEMYMNNASTGSYTVYFNVPQGDLGSISSSNIRLFVYDAGWTELTTTVVDGTSDPAQFYATITHFSNFIIGERSGGSGGSQTPGAGGGGAGRGGKAVKEKPVETVLKPVHIKGNLFDVSVLIPEKYRELFSGEELIAEVNIINLKRIGFVDVSIEHYIEDSDKNVVYRELESRGVEIEISYLNRIKLFSDIKPGNYMFYAKVKYNSDVAIAGYPFKVIEKVHVEEPSLLRKNYILIYSINILTILIIAIIFMRYEHKKFKRIEKLVNKISEKDLKKDGLIKRR